MRERSANRISQGRANTIQLSRARENWLTIGVCIGLLLITWLVFGQTRTFEFINFDDGDYVYKNRHVAGGLTLSGISWAFTNVHAGNWHPLTWISHMLDCQLYGLEPRGHHLSNVIIHGATVILLFLVLRRMTAGFWRSAFVAAAFAIHPLRVESVAWVAERKDVLSGLFFVLTIAAYIRYTRKPSLWSYGLLFVTLALGLMSKPMLVTVPFVLLLLDYWPLNRITVNEKPRPWRLILEKLPLLILAIGASAITLLAQKEAIQGLTYVPVLTRIGNMVVSYAVYVRQMLWPVDLTPFYPLRAEGLDALEIAFSLLLLIGISVLVLVYHRRRYLVTGWLWYLAMLIPVIGILQVGNQAHADRYTYLPQIGLCLALAWAAADLLSRWKHHQIVLGALGLTILISLALSARTQATYWKESESLWRYTLAHTSNNATAELNLGETLSKKGRLDEALEHVTTAAKIQPANATICGSMGIILQMKGKLEEALVYLRKSLLINPQQAPIHSSIGVALLELGHPEESAAHLRKAVEIDPNDSDARYNLGNTLMQMGQAAEAVLEYKRAITINPNDIQALNNLAWILATWPDALIRDGPAAVEMGERADYLTRGQNSIIGATLAAAYAEAGRFDDAVKAGQRAGQLAQAAGNSTGADSIRAQVELYRSGSAFRDRRYSSTSP